MKHHIHISVGIRVMEQNKLKAKSKKISKSDRLFHPQKEKGKHIHKMTNIKETHSNPYE